MTCANYALKNCEMCALCTTEQSARYHAHSATRLRPDYGQRLSLNSTKAGTVTRQLSQLSQLSVPGPYLIPGRAAVSEPYKATPVLLQVPVGALLLKVSVLCCYIFSNLMLQVSPMYSYSNQGCSSTGKWMNRTF